MKPATSTRYFTLFATTLGYCGIAWSETGIIRSALPDPDLALLRAHLTRGLH